MIAAQRAAAAADEGYERTTEPQPSFDADAEEDQLWQVYEERLATDGSRPLRLAPDARSCTKRVRMRRLLDAAIESGGWSELKSPVTRGVKLAAGISLILAERAPQECEGDEVSAQLFSTAVSIVEDHGRSAVIGDIIPD